MSTLHYISGILLLFSQFIIFLTLVIHIINGKLVDKTKSIPYLFYSWFEKEKFLLLLMTISWFVFITYDCISLLNK